MLICHFNLFYKRHFRTMDTLCGKYAQRFYECFSKPGIAGSSIIEFCFLCDWCITVPLGLIAAFILKLPVFAVYFIVNLDEIVKLPAVYRHYIKYKWVKDLTVKENEK